MVSGRLQLQILVRQEACELAQTMGTEAVARLKALRAATRKADLTRGHPINVTAEPISARSNVQCGATAL
jgi:hypothetical protein